MSMRTSGQSTPHESARAQVAGAATYLDDIAEVRGTLYAAPILSRVAHGRLRAIDSAAARAMPGVCGVVLAADIPGDTMLAAFAGDEPIFAMDTVQHVGQVLGLVVLDLLLHWVPRSCAGAVTWDPFEVTELQSRRWLLAQSQSHEGLVDI